MYRLSQANPDSQSTMRVRIWLRKSLSYQIMDFYKNSEFENFYRIKIQKNIYYNLTPRFIMVGMYLYKNYS